VLREICALPFNLLKIHFKMEDKMVRRLSDQSTLLIVRSAILFGLDPLFTFLVYSLTPLLGPLSLTTSTFLAAIGLTNAFPTTETYKTELQLGLYGLGSLMMALVLVALFRRKIAAKKVLLAWGMGLLLPQVLYRLFLDNYGFRDFQAISDSQVYFLLGQVKMFQSILSGATLGYLFGHVVPGPQRPWFVLAGALGCPLISFAGRYFFPGFQNPTEGILWSTLAGKMVYGLASGVLVGILFGLVRFLAVQQEHRLKPA
jgi:hypothetical protein